MIRGLYTSALGLAAMDKRQEVSSNNLANANTVGYKKETVITKSFPEMLLHRLEDPALPAGTRPVTGNVGTGVQIAGIITDYSKGILQETGVPTELALVSEGYFVVNTPQGERYTRNGEFKIGPEGRLLTNDGYTVMGQNGEINLSGGNLTADEFGNLFNNGTYVDTLRIVQFTNPLIKEGSSLFQGEEPQEMELPQVTQGFLEGSNVNTIEEMVNMITIMRAYETNMKVIQTTDSTLDKAVNDVGRV